MRLADVFHSERKAFVAYLTVGDPSLAASEQLVKALAFGGADIIELGVPFSDPVADGPTNQRAAHRALQSGTSLRDVLVLAGHLRREGITTPFVLFTYYNPILRLGLDEFTRLSEASGIDGVLAVDLPIEEADAYRAALARHRLATVFLASPTTTADRRRRLAEASTGFLYYVSRTGVTGARQTLSATLNAELAELKRQVAVPVCVGFGISTAEQVAAAAALADGVVVGSALVETIEKGGADAVTDLVNQVRRLSAPLRTFKPFGTCERSAIPFKEEKC